MTYLTVPVHRTGLEIEATELQIILELKRHNYTVGKLWCFWASYTTGAVVALSGECLGAADCTTWSCPRSIDTSMCEWVGLVRLL